MKKILIITASFPPESSVGGLRPFYLFKYFNQTELDTYIFTINHVLSNNKMDLNIDKSLRHKIHYCNFSKSMELEYLKKRSIWNKVRDFLNPTYSSPPGLLDLANEKIQQVYNINDFDLILATVPDLWTAQLGYLICKKYDKKLIIDFRDAHEQERGMPRSFRETVLTYRLLAARKKIINNAFELITVSKYLAQQLEVKFKKKTTVIYNGYDKEIFTNMDKMVFSAQSPRSSKVKIVYIGRILSFWYRNPFPLINVLEKLAKLPEMNKKFELHFYGVEKMYTSSIINKKDLKNIFFHERVNYNKVNDLLNEADLLLVLTNNGRRGILTTKLYEYMPLNKPVICLPNDDQELEEIINQYGLGFSLKNQEEIYDFFMNFDQKIYDIKNKRKLCDDVKFFTRENQSKILSKYLIEILN